MSVLNITGYGDVDVRAPAQSSVGIIGDVDRAFSGVLRADTLPSAAFRVWPIVTHPMANASADALYIVLMAGVGVPFNVSGDLIGSTVAVLASNIGDSKDVDSPTHKTLTFTLSQVTP